MSRKLLYIIAVAILLNACKKNSSPYWDVDLLLPLAHTELKLQNIIPDSNQLVDTNNALTLVYNTNLFSLKLDTVFAIPDTTTTDEFQLPVGSLVLQPGQQFLADSQDTKYDLGGAELKFLRLRSGTIKIALSSTLGEKTIFNYTVPSATLQGVPLTIRAEIPAGTTTNPSVINRQIDVSGYDFNLTGKNNDEFNVISSFYTATIDSNGQAVLVTQSDKFLITYTYENMVLEYARGYFGSDLIEENSEGDPLDAFNNILSGFLALDESQIDITIVNELGIDIQAELFEVTAINNANQVEVSLRGSLIGHPVNLNRATENGTGYPPLIRTSYSGVMTDSNSNVTEFISNLPDKVSYRVSALMNPLGNVSGGNDFTYNNTGVTVNLDASIPLKFSATNLVLADTTDFELDNSVDKHTQRINSGFIRVLNENWYPLSGIVQFYFYDSSIVLLDSLFDIPAVVPAATPDGTGVVTIPENSVQEAPVSGEKIDRLYRAAFVEIFVTLNTSNQPDKVQFYNHYKMDLKLVGDFNYNLIVNDL